jgi:predicted O-linked N-acetylglucosamine transferase (SPINDLY family)
MVTTDETLRAALDHRQAGRLAEAESLCRQALQSDPRHPGALHLLGAVALDAGRPDLAARFIRQAVAIDPSQAAYHLDLGEAYRKSGRRAEARTSYEQALLLDPGHLTAHNSLGILCQEQGDLSGAEAHFREAARLGPDRAFVLNNLGTLLLHRGALDEARTILDQALLLRPDYAEGHNNLGAVWVRLGRYDEARACFVRAVALKPGYAVAHHNLGSVLHKEGRLGDAEASLRLALRHKPDYAPAHYELGAVLMDALRLDEAQARLEEAVRVKPDYTEAMGLLATVLGRQGKVAEARAWVTKALATRPDDGLKIRSALLLPVIYRSLDELQQERARLRADLARLSAEPLSVEDPVNAVGVNAFFLAYQGLDDRDLMSDLSALYRKATPGLEFVAPHCTDPARATSREGPIRVGFLSNFFHEHTVGRLNLGFVRHLSRERFSVTLFRFPGADDPLSSALQQAADRVVTLPRRLDAARQLVADEGLDALYYPEIGMDPLTCFLAFARLAPVQCVSWGHPVTSGIPTVDYFLSGAPMEPEGAAAHYTERLVRFRKFNAYYFEPKPSTPPPTRRDLGLDEGAHLYVCTQSLFKLHPSMDEALGAILRADPSGLLVLLSGVYPRWDATLANRFRRTFPKEAGRVRFLPRRSRDDFLHLQALADVLLDTFPFCGGNTSYEAFAVGTPVVTLPGALLRGRLTFALYQQMGVPDCVADDPRHYVEIALRLANDPAWREHVRGRILAAKHRIFEDAEAVRELEGFLVEAVTGRRPGPSG